MYKQVNADDNKDHEQEEARRRDERNKQREKTGESHPERGDAQADRDNAELQREQGQSGAASGTENNRDVIDKESKLGRGPGGLNTGPSDTFSADPHNPRDNSRIAGGVPEASQRSQGTGQSPPRGEQPTSDKPQPHVPTTANPAGQDQARQESQERRDARAQERDGKAGIEDAEKRIADTQSKPAPEREDKGKDKDKR